MLKSIIIIITLTFTIFFKSINANYTNFYSGYITVNSTSNAKLFYQLIPVNDTNLTVNAPVILWLQGGPGCSSQYSNWMETGPYYIQNISGNLTPVARNITWNSKFHMIYLDNPSTVGYSIPGTENVTNTTIAAQEMLTFLQQFFDIYSELQQYDFFIFGESYAGHYIPALAYEILISGSIIQDGGNIPLAGIGIGNAWTDPINQMVYGEYSFAAGVVDYATYEIIKNYELQAIQYILQGNYIQANNVFNTIEAFIQSTNVTGGVFINNYRQYFPNVPILDLYSLTEEWLNLNSTKQIMNVPLNQTFTLCSSIINNWWAEDIPQSVSIKLAYVLNNLPVLLYNGADDIEVNTMGVLNFIAQLPWNGIEIFRNSYRQIWMMKNGVAGNVKIGSNLTFATVYGSGHIVPFDQPLKALDMATRFIYGVKNWTIPGIYQVGFNNQSIRV